MMDNKETQQTEPIDENVFVLINNYFIKKNVNLSQIYCINNNSKLEEYKKKYNSDINVYKIKQLSTTISLSVPANQQGEIWLVIGTDSGFEGKTTIYYNSIQTIIK